MPYTLLLADDSATIQRASKRVIDSRADCLEHAGDFVIPLDAVTAVLEEKVIVDVAKLPDRLQNAIRHAHDAEDFP